MDQPNGNWINSAAAREADESKRGRGEILWRASMMSWLLHKVGVTGEVDIIVLNPLP